MRHQRDGGVLCKRGADGVDRSDTDKTLNFSKWQLYFDIDPVNGNAHPTLDQFKAKTSVTVHYTEDVNDGDSFYAKIAPALGAGQDTGRDLFALPDSQAARLIRNNYVQKLDKTRIPNVAANLIDSLKSPSWDPNRDFAAPWQSGVTGIAYNSAKVPEMTTPGSSRRSRQTDRVGRIRPRRRVVARGGVCRGLRHADVTHLVMSIEVARCQARLSPVAPSPPGTDSWL